MKYFTPAGQKVISRRSGLVLLCTLFTLSLGANAQALGSFAISGGENWSYENYEGHIWEITYTNGSYAVNDITRASGTIPAAPNTRMASFSTDSDQHWVYQTKDGHIRQVVYSTGFGTYSSSDLTVEAQAPMAVMGTGLAAFATSYDQHFIFQTGDGHVWNIIQTYSPARFGNLDLTLHANAEAPPLLASLSGFATNYDQHYVFQTGDGHIRQIVYSYSNSRFGYGDLSGEAPVQPLQGTGLTSFATPYDQHWVFQASDGHIGQIVYTYSSGSFGYGDLIQAVNANASPLLGTPLSSFATAFDQDWVFLTTSHDVAEIVYTYRTGSFAYVDVTQATEAQPSTKWDLAGATAY